MVMVIFFSIVVSALCSTNTAVVLPDLNPAWQQATRSIIGRKAESNRLTDNDGTRRLYSRRVAPRGRQ